VFPPKIIFRKGRTTTLIDTHFGSLREGYASTCLLECLQ